MEPAVKLLIVDDDEVDRMIIKRSLRTAKVEATITNAALGSEALDAVSQQTFDFIFIDFMLPDMNGLEVLQKIREKGITTPVQIVTSQGDERIAVEAIKTGASDYLPKTLLTPEGISQSIRTAIRLHKIEQERLQTQEQLAKTQKQLDTVINGAPLILWATDQDGIFTMARGKGLPLIGKSEGQSVGKSVFEVYADYPIISKCVRRTLNGNRSTCTINIRGVWFDCLFLPLRNTANEVNGIIGVCYNITERIMIEEELKRAKDEALSMARVKEQFLANMSHEIRTPMNGILGLSEVLAKTPLNESQKEYLQGIHASANNLMVIINDLLDFSKIEAGKITFEHIPFDLKQTVKQLLDILEIRAIERHNSLKLLFDQDIPPMVQGDPFRLSQILNNLIGNALKFTENGSVRLNVEVVGQEEDQLQLEFTVKDTGIGIPKEKLETIFEKFTQGSNDTTRKFGGTGLGLSIAKELIESQGGHITVESELNVGSTFRFVLPFRKADEKPHLSGKTVSPDAADLKLLQNARILLAEDNSVNQMLVTKILKDHRVRVSVVNNGREALDLLAEQPFDLLLMDMQMPEMDGYEAMQYIRHQMPEFQQIPIIALTAHATQGEFEKCLGAGANSYVSKPFKAEKLLQEISILLQSKEDEKTIPEASDPEEVQIDLAYLENFANGNREFMRDILQLFITQTPRLVKDLTKAVSLSNWLETRTLAHKIKPSIALVGIQQLEELNDTIEQSALNLTHTEQLPELARQLEDLVNRSIVQLNIELENLQGKLV
ncbi:hybrid sensor histidine kinase/response regulator [Rufibacter latericius]|uniref:Sensory/regulatory protein RpfC n=1 Tax=Rufibacter latericius TaxID=2487040 RepID=A0A3M9MA73_9BACT|nr:response regulator [Rufibacter latericius]RNI22470.1 hybrid sensor histidine kinase/response regulator [Rufibacter latericius]